MRRCKLRVPAPIDMPWHRDIMAQTAVAACPGGMSHSEVAALMGVSSRTIITLEASAFRKIRSAESLLEPAVTPKELEPIAIEDLASGAESAVPDDD